MVTELRPLVLGYIPAHPFVTDVEVDETKQQLVRFAEVEGYTLGVVYVERNDGKLAAFHALMAEVERLEAAGVLVLSLPRNMREDLEQYTSAKVVIAQHTPP